MIIIGSDHTGVSLKERIKEYLDENGIDYFDATKNNDEQDDYPDMAYAISKKVLENDNNIGIAICGTGIGISIACNKVKGVRAADCVDVQMAEYSKRHNNANVLCLGANLEFAKDFEKVKEIISTFMNSKFEGGRHLRRVEKIAKIEQEGDMYVCGI